MKTQKYTRKRAQNEHFFGKISQKQKISPNSHQCGISYNLHNYIFGAI